MDSVEGLQIIWQLQLTCDMLENLVMALSSQRYSMTLIFVDYYCSLLPVAMVEAKFDEKNDLTEDEEHEVAVDVVPSV